MVCTFFAFAQLPVADVVTLTNTFPLWVAVLSWPLYGHFPGSKMIVAILIGVAGVALVEQPHFARGNLGVLAALAAAAFTAVAMLGLHSLGNLDPRAIVVHFSAVATVFCFAAFLIGPHRHDPTRVLEWGVMWKLLGIGATALVGQLFLTLAFAAVCCGEGIGGGAHADCLRSRLRRAALPSSGECGHSGGYRSRDRSNRLALDSSEVVPDDHQRSRRHPLIRSRNRLPSRQHHHADLASSPSMSDKALIGRVHFTGRKCESSENFSSK